MTTTLESQRELVETIKEMEAPYKAIFGGAPCSQEWCDEIGADYYTSDAASAADVALAICEGRM